MPFDLAHFVTLDRQDGSSRAGAEVSHTIAAHGPNLRCDVHGQYFDDEYGVGGYVAVPFSLGSTATEGRNLLGNVEAGAMFVSRDDDRVLALHVGALLPTTWNFTDNHAIAVTNFYPRLTDAPQSSGAGLYGVRFGIGFGRREGRTFSQLEGGADLLRGGNDTSSMHFNGAFGIDLGDAALMVESTNGYGNGKFVDNGALAVRFAAGHLQPYAAVIVGIAGTHVYEGATVGVDVML